MDTVVTKSAPRVEAEFDPVQIGAEINALAERHTGRDDAFRSAITQLLKNELAKGRAAAQAQLLGPARPALRRTPVLPDRLDRRPAV